MVVLIGGGLAAGILAQAPTVVRPIEAATTPLPSEATSAGVTGFSFFIYGDTRSAVDGQALQPDHGVLVDRMLEYEKANRSTRLPVRFVIQSGDAVTRGPEAVQWNTSFSPLIDRLTRAGLPYFFTMGNHDAPPAPEGARALGVANALDAMSNLMPPEGSARRLTGYPTYAFGYGNLFAVAIDSNIAADPNQLAWVEDQLSHLDRRRFPHVLFFFHHPVFSSGPHGGSSPSPSTTTMAEDSVEPQTAALRKLWAPLMRRYHVRVTVSGHDHLYDHFVERWVDGGLSYRRDDVVSGGGGAPIYTYRGEPELNGYLAAGAAQQVRVDHLVKPGKTAAENPHHFVVFRVDGDRLSLQVIGNGQTDYRPYGDRTQIDLNDR